MTPTEVINKIKELCAADDARDVTRDLIFERLIDAVMLLSGFRHTNSVNEYRHD